jgi:two-component SAPR family response regulator
MRVDITLLGGFSVLVAGAPVADGAWRRRSASAVVKLLSLSEGRALHREQVVDLLWPHLPAPAALPRLHQAAHYARNALGRRDGVVLRRDRVHLLPEADVRVDALEFRRRAERALTLGTADAADGVLAEYPAELLPEDLYAEWAAPHRESVGVLRDRLQRLTGRSSEPELDDLPAGAARSVRGLAGHHHGGRRSRTLLLVIDDLAAADPASLRMLHHVAANITARGIGRVVELD